MSSCTFAPKAPTESVKLGFNFAPELPTGVTLTGVPAVTFVTEFGVDASPSALANGAQGFNAALTQVVVPVKAGLDGVNYRIKVIAATTDAALILEMDGLLQIRNPRLQ